MSGRIFHMLEVQLLELFSLSWKFMIASIVFDIHKTALSHYLEHLLLFNSLCGCYPVIPV